MDTAKKYGEHTFEHTFERTFWASFKRSHWGGMDASWSRTFLDGSSKVSSAVEENTVPDVDQEESRDLLLIVSHDIFTFTVKHWMMSGWAPHLNHDSSILSYLDTLTISLFKFSSNEVTLRSQVLSHPKKEYQSTKFCNYYKISNPE